MTRKRGALNPAVAARYAVLTAQLERQRQERIQAARTTLLMAKLARHYPHLNHSELWQRASAMLREIARTPHGELRVPC